MNKRKDQHLSAKEIELLNEEVARLTNEHNRFTKLICKFGWIIILVLCSITMLVPNSPKTYISLAWIGIGLILGIWIWIEDLIKTTKNIKPIKKAIATNDRKDVASILRDISLIMKKTTREDLETIEKLLNLQFPDYYKSTIMNYPFPKGSFAEGCLLPYYPDLIIKNNESSFLENIKTVGTKPFFIGSDGGEELYYIDLNSKKSEVFVYSFETGKSDIYVNSWDEYLKDVERVLREIEKDEN